MQKHRYRQYMLWLSEDEENALNALCEKTALSKASVLRRLIMGEQIRERPNADFKKLTDEINDIGVNFNQLVHVVNTVGYASPENLKQTQLYFDRIIRKLRSWEKTWR